MFQKGMPKIWFTTPSVNSLNFNYHNRMPGVLGPATGQLVMAMASVQTKMPLFHFFALNLHIAEKCETKIHNRFFQLDEQLCCKNQLAERLACL